MNKKILKKYAIAVYTSVILASIILLLLATYVLENQEYKSIMINIATELLGAGFIYFIVQVIFGLDNENKSIEDKIDKIIYDLDNNKNYKIIDKNSPTYNEEFYKYFNEKIENAEHTIFITGEGFECKDTDGKGKKLANDFIEAHRIALRKPRVQIVRLQTNPRASKHWNDLLKALLEKFPNQFHLYLKTTLIKSKSIASICTIDESDDINNVTEFMFSTKSKFGDKTVNLAGLAVFVKGNRKLCSNMQSLIDDEINDDLTIKIDIENFDKHMTDSVLCFSYGSNLDMKQMIERCPSAKKISNGYIEDYKLVFNREGTVRKGGVASIVFDEECKTYGINYLISKDDLVNLDKKEFKDGAYERKQMKIAVSETEYLESEVYVSIPQKGSFKPSKEYINLIISGAKKAEFPNDYIKYLESFRS